MTDKEKTIKELKEALDSLDITNKYRLNLIRAIEYLQEEPVSDVKTRVKEIFDSCEKIDVSDDEKNRVAFGLLELEGFAKMFYKMGKQQEEPVSEDLEEAASRYAKSEYDRKNPATLPERCKGCYAPIMYAFKAGAKWQKTQDTKNKLPKVTDRTELDEYAYQCTYDMSNDWAIENPTWHDVEMACKLGANWQKENLWKSANGDDLPKIDREVIALIRMDGFFQIPPDEPVEMTYKVVFAHRPNPDGWDGKSLTTGEVEHYTPQTYGKGGWNIPDVKWWLDCSLPNMED